jgi:DNA-binding MarR family transcriptional regulator
VNPKHIASQLRYDSGALTRVIDQLEQRGLLERVRRDRDRRKVCLRLTPAACDTVDRLGDLMHDRLGGLLPNFNTDEVRELARLLQRFTSTLQSAVEAGEELNVVGQ